VRKLPVRKLPARKILWAAVAGALFLPLQGFTLGLGEIEVNSGLNQKLNAEIELLSATVEDTENLIIKLASRKDFSRAGLDRPYLLNDLQFKSVVVNGVPHINVSSGSPIREPFLNFLVEIDWPNGHLLREYTVLLDPPVFMTQTASSSSASPARTAEAVDDSGFRPGAGGSANIVPVTVPGSSASFRPQATAQTAPAQYRYAVAPVATAGINQLHGSYKIKAGDTAWSLADSMRPDQSVSVEQMMIAMLRTNPESFINENINGLKRGYILRAPDYDQILSISQADAKALVSEQAALWRQLQKAQSAGQPVSAMPDDGISSAGAGSGSELDGDASHLEIISAGSGSSTGSAKDPTLMSAEELRGELALARERVETERVEKEALQQRVDSLESNVDAMKGMLSIEDDDLAGAQSLNMPVADTDDISGEMTADDSGLTEQEIAARQELLEALEGEAADGEMIAEQTSEDVAEIDVSEDEELVFVDETEAAEDAAVMSQDMPVEQDIAAPLSPPVVERPEPDLLSKLLSDPILLAAAGGGLLLFVALIALLIKRRKAAAEDVDDESADGSIDDLESLAEDIAADSEDDTDDLVDMPADEAEAKTDDFDSDATMVLNSPDDTIKAEAGDVAEEIEEESRDDVIAEADVYLAYGIYQQAEELLAKAIADNPDRDDYRVKLAETHYASKNAAGFVEVATEIRKNLGADETPAWKKVMGMGQDLCPDETLFQGSVINDAFDTGESTTPEMDIDLGINEADDVVADLDLSLDNELELPDMDDSSSNLDETAAMDIDTSDSFEDVTEDADDAGVADEIEFDIDVAGAVDESSEVESEFSLDIDAAELDIGLDETDDSAEEVSIEIDEIEIGLQETDDSAEEVSIEIDEIESGLDETDSSTDENLSDEAPADEVHGIEDVDIDFGLDDEQVDEAVELDDGEVSIDLSAEAEAMDMDTDESNSVAEADAEAEAEETDAEAEETDAEAEETDLTMDIDSGDAGSEVADSEMADSEMADSEMELEGIDSDVVSADDEVAAETTDDSMEDDFDLSSLGDADEISTKLDLARAYLDMGDDEGTRGILEEVIAEGNDEQKKEANELMGQLK